jgi:hypothetical protein
MSTAISAFQGLHKRFNRCANAASRSIATIVGLLRVIRATTTARASVTRIAARPIELLSHAPDRVDHAAMMIC